MERIDNYAIQASQAKKHFLTYDQEKLIAKFSLNADDDWFYVNFFCAPYRISRRTGDMDRLDSGSWVSGNSFAEVMTLLDLLCDSRDDRHISGRWKSLEAIGLQFHQSLLEDGVNIRAQAISADPARFERACRALGGRPITPGDMAYAFPIFEDLELAFQFWDGDEDFPARLRWLWDENAKQYLRYETMHYAVGLLFSRLMQEAARQ